VLPHLRTAALCIGIAFAIASGAIAVGAQDPLVTLPNNYRLIFDNSDVAAIHAHYGAHEKVPVHDHPSVATVFVYLNDSGQVRIDHPEAEGKVESVIRPPTATGAFRVVAGMAETHSIENLGDTSSDFLRVELKNVSLDTLKEPFRGKAPQSVASSQDTIEFTAPGLQIERIICAGASPCPVKASFAPSLIVAISPVSFAATATPKEMLNTGSVRWLPSARSATVTAPANAPGQVLRILLPVDRP
jgi:hypothetical protein